MKKQQLKETINFLKSNGITSPAIGIVLGNNFFTLSGVSVVAISKSVDELPRSASLTQPPTIHASPSHLSL